MMRLVPRLAILFYLLICVTSIASADPLLLNKTWFLTSINSVPLEVLNFPDNKPYLKLAPDNRYVAYAGCNQLIGSYELDEGEITFSQAAMTMMACPNNMDFEQEFVSMLDQIAFWGVEGEGHTLNLRSIDMQILAVFNDSPP